VPRYLVIRTFDVDESEMPEVGSRSRKVMTFCVYDAPSEEIVRRHGDDLGKHTIDDVLEIAGDVTPADFPV